MRAAGVGAAAAAVLGWPPRRAPTSERSTAAATTSRTPPGDRSGGRTRASRPPAYADGDRQAADRPPARHVSNRVFNDGAQNLFSENGVTQWGFAWGQFMDHTFGLREEAAARGAPIAFDAARPAGDVPQRLRRDRLHRARPPRPGRARPASAPADQHGLELHRRLERLRRHRRAPRVAARGPGRRRPRQQRRAAAAARAATCRAAEPAATPPRRPAMALEGRLPAQPAQGDGRRRRARQREHRADRHPHAVRPRAQPDRRRAAGRLCPRSRSSRSPAGSSAPSSSTSPTRSSCPALGVALPPYRGYDPTVDATPRQRVRDRRLPRAQHDPRRDRAVRARRHVHRGAARRRSRRRASRSRRTTDERRARDPAQRRVRQPRPAREPSASARCCRRSAPSREYRNDERSTTSCAACCSRCRGRASRTRAPASTGRRCRTASTASSTSARSTSSAAATTACRSTTTLRRAYGLRAEAVVHRDHRRGDRPVPGRHCGRSTTRTSSTSSRCSTSTGDAIAARRRGAARVDRRAADDARRAAARDLRRRRQARRLHRHALRAARARHRVRRAAAGDLEAAVRGAARRRPVLLRQRPGARADRARLRHQLPAHARAGHRRTTPGSTCATTSSSCRRARRYEHGDGVGATVPPTLSLALGAPASFGAFTPGVARDYVATTTATVISTAGDAALIVSEPRPPDQRLRPAALAARRWPAPERDWSAPASNDAVTVTFNQHIGATDALRTGSYSQALAFTLSTTTP